jgi:hypothetical protein
LHEKTGKKTPIFILPQTTDFLDYATRCPTDIAVA